MKSTFTNTNLKQDLYDMSFKRTICVDFDGVIHAYSQGWNEGEIYDEPVPGAFEFLANLVADDRFEVAIYSSRSKHEGGVVKMQEWMHKHGLDSDTLCALQFPTKKPAAWMTIDDRAICFQGIFPSPEFLLSYQPWNKSAFKVEDDIALLRRLAEGFKNSNTDTCNRLLRIADRLAVK